MGLALNQYVRNGIVDSDSDSDILFVGYFGNQDDPKVKPAADMHDKMSTMQEKLAQQHDKSQNSQGSIAWEGDAFSQVMGKEKHGRIRGLGLGPTPTEILGMPTTWHSEEVLKLQEKVDSMQGIITNLQAANSAKSFKVKELEDRLACLEGLFNKHNGPSKQICEGIEPEIELPERSSDCRLAQYCNESGMVPLS
ncbi:hypothetical protein Ancab_006213 [Ancistrocladus abbreviatus]